MKKIIKYLFLALFAGFTMVSCDFLDVVPAEKASDKDAFSGPKAAERFLYRSLLSYVELQFWSWNSWISLLISEIWFVADADLI